MGEGGSNDPPGTLKKFWGVPFYLKKFLAHHNVFLGVASHRKICCHCSSTPLPWKSSSHLNLALLQRTCRLEIVFLSIAVTKVFFKMQPYLRNDFRPRSAALHEAEELRRWNTLHCL